jgi:hypothetical protein
MPVEIDNEAHCRDFVRLNELWITECFSLEEADRKLAEDPYRIVREGGHILSLVENGYVVGVCALFRESAERYELARMAVDPGQRGKGYARHCSAPRSNRRGREVRRPSSWDQTRFSHRLSPCTASTGSGR